ncbi:transposase [Anabaena sp. PCC 7108]|uniref:transposase n=1 Tax=Anabaena sp. PCC 7108 TaxID=163908 RepID=UPI00350E96C4
MPWYYQVIAYFNNRKISANLEVINNKFKLIKNSGYKSRNLESFRIWCLLN